MEKLECNVLQWLVVGFDSNHVTAKYVCFKLLTGKHDR